jgi:hypothetical protein
MDWQLANRRKGIRKVFSMTGELNLVLAFAFSDDPKILSGQIDPTPMLCLGILIVTSFNGIEPNHTQFAVEMRHFGDIQTAIGESNPLFAIEALHVEPSTADVQRNCERSQRNR